MVDIRDAVADDAPVLLELACALTAEAGGGTPTVRITADRLAGDLDAGATNALIAELDGEIVGFATFSFLHLSLSGTHLYLDDLYIAPDQRGSGVGRRLVAEVAARARDRSCAGMVWFVESDNEGALRFYDRLGASIAESRLIMTATDLDRLIDHSRTAPRSAR